MDSRTRQLMESYRRNPHVLQVTCPRCDAPPDEFCKSAKGNETLFHVSRAEAGENLTAVGAEAGGEYDPGPRVLPTPRAALPAQRSFF